MYFSLSDSAYACIYRKSAIILDVKDDTYLVLSESETVCFRKILKMEFEKAGDTYKTKANGKLDEKLNTLLLELLESKILKPSFVPFRRPLRETLSTAGMPNIDWRLPRENKFRIRDLGMVFVAFCYLIYVHFCMRFVGFYFLIKRIRALKKRNFKTPSRTELETLQRSVNWACKIFPFRTKCLEWALVFSLMGLKRGMPVNLVIGVQNYPFLSHAWVEWKGEIIGDDPSLRKNLGIVLVEPFGVGT